MMFNKRRFLFGYALLLAALFLVFLLNLGFGSADISAGEIFSIIFGGGEGGDSSGYIIIQKIRLPRALASIMAGAALALAGLLLQTFFANPIVDSYVLGVSSGSTLFVGFVMLGGYAFGFRRMPPAALITGAFLGAMAVMAVILFASRRVKSIVTLLIIGLMCGYLCSAGTGMLSAFAEKEEIARFSIWAMGNFSGIGWPELRVLYALTLPLTAAALLLGKPLNALNIGENYAITMGVNVKTLRSLIILISSLLTASVTAFAGPVSFIGLAVPHICRSLFRTQDARILTPGIVLGGALMASFCDFAARTALSPVELPLSSVTALVGAPIVVWLLSRRRYEG
ncbi:MAG: iron ABC transporter permease [Spirochaetaceae bacterium]|jgi:iron complex transport system permease protein|nr:iron ABC transporter permease [Spirochaetaceae bacterium]